MKRFWILSFIWVALVAAGTPILIEAADRRGIGLVVPGLPVTASEILAAAVLAFAPPLGVLMWMRRKRSAA